MCDPLGKNLQLPSWFDKDFEEESSASSLGIILGVLDSLGKNLLLPSWFMEDFEEESSASLLGIFLVYRTHRGRILYFLTRDTLGKNLLLPSWV